MSNPISHLPNTADTAAYNQSPAAVDALGWNEPMPGVYTSDPQRPAPAAPPAYKDTKPLPGVPGHGSASAPMSDYSTNAIQNVLLQPSEVEAEDNRLRQGGVTVPHAHRFEDQSAPHPAGNEAAHDAHRQPNTEHGVNSEEYTAETRAYVASSLQSPRYDMDGQPTGFFEKGKDHAQTKTKPSLGDKVIGKTEEIAGKITGNVDLQEKGQARGHPGPQS